MRTIIRKNILITIFVLGLTNYTLATPALPTSNQMGKEEKIEIIPEIKIEAQSANATSNPKLKDGTACSDEDLEEIEGELFVDIPMARTIPCNEVDCKDLGAAKTLKDDYEPLPVAETINCDKK